MGTTIEKIVLQNFRRFQFYTVLPNPDVNVLIGDNEAGKSSILEAIDLVASGNMRRVESIGIDKLLNAEVVQKFGEGERTIDNLPIMRIELFLDGQFDHTMNGKNNTDRRICDGIRLAFADEAYTGYKKKLRSIKVDSAKANTEFATNDFVRRMYRQYTESNENERIAHKSNYRQMRANFQKENFKSLNERVPNDKHYSFGLKGGSSIDLESDMMIYEDDISIDNKGTGKQVFVKTEFALEHAGENVDVILIEEPENHLSPVNLRKLVQRVASTKQGQLFITTHSSMISTRLEINNLLIMDNNSCGGPIKLSDLKDETAKYFAKTPPASIVEYALATKAILVEGPAEYMLMDKFYRTITGISPEEDDVHVIDVRGLSFKRYLEIAKLTGSKVAVITDNDKDYEKHCVAKYKDYKDDSNIKEFYEDDDSMWTFEIVLEACNKTVCKESFGQDAVSYMLNNKTESAYKLLSSNKSISVPGYIERAIEWIRQ